MLFAVTFLGCVDLSNAQLLNKKDPFRAKIIFNPFLEDIFYKEVQKLFIDLDKVEASNPLAKITHTITMALLNEFKKYSVICETGGCQEVKDVSLYPWIGLDHSQLVFSYGGYRISEGTNQTKSDCRNSPHHLIRVKIDGSRLENTTCPKIF